MPFNGSGGFTLAGGTFTQPVTGTTISSSAATTGFADIASNGLTNCLTKDGQTTPSANIPLGGYKITGLGAGSAATDAAQLQQVQNATNTYVLGVAGVTTITGSLSPAITSYTEGIQVSATMIGANGAGATMNLNSVGAAPIFWNLAAVPAGLWATANAIDLLYLSTSVSAVSATGFHVIGHSGFVPANLLTVKGALYVGKGGGQVEVLAPGTDGQVLVATASASSGLGWSTPASVPVAATQAQMNAMTDVAAFVNANLNKIILMAEASATGTNVEFTGIPAGVRRVDVMVRKVSTNGTANMIIQIGDAGGYTTAYASGACNAGPTQAQSTDGFIISVNHQAAGTSSGVISLMMENTATFSWCSMGNLRATDPTITYSAGDKSLSSELTTLRIRMDGTDKFDSGAFAVSYAR